MLNSRQLRSILQYKYGLCVGERTLEQVRRKLAKVISTKIKISGRSNKTGRKKAVSAKFTDLNW